VLGALPRSNSTYSPSTDGRGRDGDVVLNGDCGKRRRSDSAAR
jgi:hypothetical protein